eukprot:TRINITY_DN2374_c0_g1_i1.p2 TRINITY_DN2374_c0_g1~~TRINITY_DN2374_c0_g1_i1.p2  ORF type:complete len:242 (-),score=56.78 TRINITY_DN2374_c0_g1_i1:1411-2136(-)
MLCGLRAAVSALRRPLLFVRHVAGASLAGRSYLIPTLRVREGVSADALQQELVSSAKRAPSMYLGAPVVIDLAGDLNTKAMTGIVEAIRSAGMVVAGITGTDASALRTMGLPYFAHGKPAPSATPRVSSTQKPTMVINGHVRGGQQVYGNGGGVTVLGSVHEGGEVIADGDIHVLGALKGRALAGVSGDTNAVIIAAQFSAQLVSIANMFLACEEVPEGVVVGKPTRVMMEGNQLVFASYT